MERMWRNDIQEEKLLPDKRNLEQSLIMKVVRYITKGDIKSRACVYYILIVLVNENLANMGNELKGK